MRLPESSDDAEKCIQLPCSPQRCYAITNLDRLNTLRRVKFGVKDAHGPETVLLDKAGRLHALCEDGWVREIREDGTTDRWAYVGGRPLGAAFDTVC